MEQTIAIVIAESDRLYLEELKDYVAENHKYFKLLPCGRVEQLNEYLQTEKIDILLIDDSFRSDVTSSSKAHCKILFTKQKSYMSFPGWETIYKYQRMDDIFSKILSIHKNKLSAPHKTEFISFYSPIGGSGKTTLALSCALYHIKKGKRVFYLTWENISGTPFYLPTKSGQNIVDLFIALKSNNEHIPYKIQSLKVQDPITKIEYFNPPQSGHEFNKIDSIHIKEMLEGFAESRNYDTVVIDLPVHFSDLTVCFLGMSNVVVMPIISGHLSSQKMKTFSQEFKIRHELSSIKDNIKIVWNKKLDGATISPFLTSRVDASIPFISGVESVTALSELQEYFYEYFDELFMIHRAL